MLQPQNVTNNLLLMTDEEKKIFGFEIGQVMT